MSLKIDMAAAARRHLEAADRLSERDYRCVAGYVYGLAAECAVKAMMVSAGVKLEPTIRKKASPYYLHFPELRTQLRDKLSGRQAKTLAAFISNDRFMEHWAIEMRYTDGKQIKEAWVKQWSEQAKQIVSSIGT